MNDLPEHIRAFVALPLPESIRHELARAQDELRSEFRDVSWTRPEAMHLTLHFFGNVERARLDELIAVLRGVVTRRSVMNLAVRGIGHFGQRVIWAGVSGDVAQLEELAAAVRDAVTGFGSKNEDRRFNAHVTLGRIRMRPERDFAGKLQRWQNTQFGNFRAEHIDLIRSELSPSGSRYSVLASLPLAG
jgi:RNA 2',3'-cyclic 3'-phosphodiesterase